MEPHLFIFRRKGARRPQYRGKIVFAVVDCDQPKGYPSNFVCILPFGQYSMLKQSSYFKVFGNTSLATAQKLLSEASRGQTDPAVLREINQRLKELQ